MGDANPIRTLGDYSKPNYVDYRNTIELPVGNNVIPLRSDTIRLVQNECLFYGLWSKDPNQHLKDFSKLMDSLDLDGEKRKERTCIYFNFPFAIKPAIGLNIFQLDPSPNGRAPKQVLIREEGKFLITKNVNSISLTRGVKEKSDKDDVAIGNGIQKTNGSNTKMPTKEAETENGAKNRIKNKPIKRDEQEEGMEAPNSQPVEYYPKHRINEKVIERLVDNHRMTNDNIVTTLVNVIDYLYNVYCKTDTAKELWQSLESKYTTKDTGTKKFMAARFLDYKMVDSNNVISQMSVKDLVVGLRIKYDDKLAQKNTYTPDFAKANMVEHPRSSKGLSNYDQLAYRAANCKTKRVTLQQTNMVNDNVDMIVLVSDVIDMIYEVILIDLPLGCKPLGYKCFFKKKMKDNVTIDKYKARLGIHYLRYNCDYGLHYDRDPADIEGYIDENWISDVKDSISTSGYVFTLRGTAISWKSSKETVIAKSTMKSKFTR
nr:zinc finger, CCHC-type [Tanacetum cinerariifolium]